MRFSISSKNLRAKSPQPSWFPESQHPAKLAPDRRSIAVLPSAELSRGEYEFESPDDVRQPSPRLLAGGLSRSQTVLRREGTSSSAQRTHPPRLPPLSPAPLWSPDPEQLPTHSEIHELGGNEAPMSIAPGKTSSDSGQAVGADRWSQRRLQRLNTEQGFREQRQGGILSPPLPPEQGQGNSYNGQPSQQAQPPHSNTLQHPPQPHPVQTSAYQGTRTGQIGPPNIGLGLQAQPAQLPTQQYAPAELPQSYQLPDTSRPPLSQARSYNSQQSSFAEDAHMTSSNGNIPASKALRSGGSNRQSVHNGLSSREAPTAQQQGTPHAAYSTPPVASVIPPAGHGRQQQPPPPQQQTQQQDAPGRNMPQPLQTGAGGDEMSEDDVAQLVKDHKELREKYTKVKKYYFEKEDQVKQLQNSLAHQRLSQSRTSLDDSEYTTRFNRLDGLVAQLAFSIRKTWKSMPDWLDRSVNKDAVSIGKQEMTAGGRSFISKWLVDEVFNKYFHPDLEPSLSAQLKAIQLNIRRFAPPAQSVEEEEYLTSKVINWRLSTLEGLQDALRSPRCADNRAQLTDMLKEQLIKTLAVHLQDPPPSDLEGGVHMIIELVVSIAIHLPVESRDVVIEYFMPGYSIMPEHMKVESGIPPLQTSIADDQADRASMKSAASDITDMTTENSGSTAHGDPPKKRSMLSALTGSAGGGSKSNKSSSSTKQHAAGAGGSSGSLHRPDSQQGHPSKDDQPPRVRMAAGIGVQVRNRTVLVKAPVFSM
ncbi:hypothetical protein KC333_g4193 [Hortaea werneckii]|nr:hypothetical protein KC333_g4193 [Hortaea werneckii]KAI7317903.1 hypothetical protein KC326_g3819 [Hortaea werneckii]